MWPLLALGVPLRGYFPCPLNPQHGHCAERVTSAGGTENELGTFRTVRGSLLLPSRGTSAHILGSLGLIGVIKFPSEHTNSHSNAVLLEISLHV